MFFHDFFLLNFNIKVILNNTCKDYFFIFFF